MIARLIADATPVDIWAMAAAVTAAAFLALRSHMLRPEFRTLTDAPMRVWLSLSALSMVCAGDFITIASGQHASPREAVLLTALAVSAVVLFANLRKQARGAAE